MDFQHLSCFSMRIMFFQSDPNNRSWRFSIHQV